MARLSFNPSGYTGASYMSVSTSTNAISNAYAGVDSTTYAQLIPSSTSSTGYLYLTFSVSGIPAGATITSVSAQVKMRINNTSRVNNCSAQLYSNTTAKGNSSSVTSTSTSNVVTLTPGSWTLSELQSLRLRINGRKTSSNQSGYIYVYGATVTVNYTLTTYNVTATSAVNGVVVSPASSAVEEGGNHTITFDVNDISDYIVTDNDVDVTSSLVRHAYESSGTVSRTADSFTTGFSGGSSMNFYTSSSSTGNNFNYAVGHTAESPGSTSSGSGSWTYVKDGSSSTSNTGYADFVFDFSSIPANATITSVQVKCYGAVEDSSESTSHSDITLYSGSTQKGTTQSFTSSTNRIITISSPGTWTRAELQSAKLRFAVGYYGGHIFGITWSVSYTTPNTGYYYTYTLNNVTAAHVILLDVAGVFIPPEEDPQYDYYPITISSINATTNPSTGTTRVVEGSNQTITITPSDPLLTLALDNGVDVTSQLVGGVPSNTYTITTKVSGASYGFNLNSSTGYYVSQNTGQATSAAVARVNFTLESDCLVTIQYINYAEATYDYGIFGAIDTALGTTYTADSGAYYTCSQSSDNSSTAKTLTYEISAGSHFIDIKYRKDNYTDSNNDTLQWKILSVEATSAGGEYTYTLTNVQQKHSLIFVFGNVSYYYVTSSGPSGMKLFPDGQFVKLAGDNYKITIVPANYGDVISLTDNNTDVTSSLVKEEGYDKYNNPAVSYTYQINNIQTTHALVFNTVNVSTDKIYIKQNGAWVSFDNLYVKINGVWVQQSLSYLSDNNITQLIQGS